MGQTEAISAQEYADPRPLDQIIRQLDLRNVPLRDAIDAVAEKTGIAINLRTRAVASAGIGLDTPVTASLTNLTVAKALDAILQNAAPNGGITYWLGDNIVEIGTQADAKQCLITRVYDVRDILNRPLEHGDPEIWQVTDDPPEEGLLEYIEKHVVPTTWADNGGSCSFRPLFGRFFVTQTPQSQDQIESLLSYLAKPGRHSTQELPKFRP